jgi:leucyl/phenylalanyl-tRNA--protein transferase
VDGAFEEVMRACAEDREDGTWIHEEMIRCYVGLHRRGHAHSVEAWCDGALVGGTYGVAVGKAFAAESKFHRVRDASKVALVALARRLAERGFSLLDVQFKTPHLSQFGVVEIARAEYLRRLRAAVRGKARF